MKIVVDMGRIPVRVMGARREPIYNIWCRLFRAEPRNRATAQPRNRAIVQGNLLPTRDCIFGVNALLGISAFNQQPSTDSRLRWVSTAATKARGAKPAARPFQYEIIEEMLRPSLQIEWLYPKMLGFLYDRGMFSNFKMHSSLTRCLRPIPLPLWVAILVVIDCFVAGHAVGQPLQIAPEWKAHFTNTPIIENCVYNYETVLGHRETNLFQFRYQDNAFLFRQIRNLDDVATNVIPVMYSYSARFDSNCWTIDWRRDGYGVLVLMPNSDNIWRSAKTNGEEDSVYIAERMLFTPLYFGIGDLDPSSVKWKSDSAFTALNVSGQEIFGHVIDVSNGLPTALEWRIATKPSNVFPFILHYKYNGHFSLSYFPSEIELFYNDGSKTTLAVTYNIIKLQTSNEPLGKDIFNPYRYFFVPTSDSNRVSTILISNNASYELSSGLPIKIPLSSALPAWIGNSNARAHPLLVRFCFISFAAISALGVFFAWRLVRSKTKQTNEQRDKT